MRKEKCDAIVTVRLPMSVYEDLHSFADAREWSFGHTLRYFLFAGLHFCNFIGFDGL